MLKSIRTYFYQFQKKAIHKQSNRNWREREIELINKNKNSSRKKAAELVLGLFVFISHIKLHLPKCPHRWQLPHRRASHAKRCDRSNIIMLTRFGVHTLYQYCRRI